MGQTYEIQVAGEVTGEELALLGATVSSTARTTTVLHGIVDQSALQGVLDRVTALGLEVLEVRLTPEEEA